MDIPSLLNTSNSSKQLEFERFFIAYGHPITFSNYEVSEIIADSVSVVAHKAVSVGKGILVEDTVLDVEGHDIGIQVKRFLPRLAHQDFVGARALWHVYMAFQADQLIYVFHASIAGVLAAAQGQAHGFGFDPYFIPDGMSKTLAQEKVDAANARFLCVKALMNPDVFATQKVGDLQHHQFDFQH